MISSWIKRIKIHHLLANCFGSLLCLGVAPCCGAYALTTLSAQEFTDSIGVDVHLMYTDGGYAKLDKAAAALK